MKFLIDNWWYFLIFGVMAFMMFRKGGCCSVGHSEHSGQSDFQGKLNGGGCCGGGFVDQMNCKDNEEQRTGYSDNAMEMVQDSYIT